MPILAGAVFQNSHYLFHQGLFSGFLFGLAFLSLSSDSPGYFGVACFRDEPLRRSSSEATPAFFSLGLSNVFHGHSTSFSEAAMAIQCQKALRDNQIVLTL